MGHTAFDPCAVIPEYYPLSMKRKTGGDPLPVFRVFYMVVQSLISSQIPAFVYSS